MSSYYGVIFPEFWTGRTGRELRERGGKDAQVLGLYLASNRHANMLGLYRLLTEDVKHETGLGVKSLQRAYEAAAHSEFAIFDAVTSFVWVRQMARIRLGLKPGVALDPEDNKVKAVNSLYGAIDPNPFLGEFFDVNHRLLRLRKRRDSVGVVVPFTEHHQMSGLPRGSEGACKPVTDNSVSKQKQDQITDQGPREDHAAPPTPTPEAFEHYQTRFLARYHGKPTIGGAKDGARMKQLLKREGLEETHRRLDAFFDSRDPWIQKSGHTLDVFFAAGTQTKLVAEMSNLAIEAPFTASELRHAKAIRDRRLGCIHEPRCAVVQVCVEAIAREVRAREKAS